MNHREQNAAAWLLYDTYQLAIWPLSAVYIGAVGLSLTFVFILGIPMFAMDLALDLRWRETNKPADGKFKTSLLHAVFFASGAACLYYFGVFLAYMFG